MANKIQLRRDTTANWNNVNPILADGEPGLDITTNQVKYGNGANAWVDLSYASSGSVGFEYSTVQEGIGGTGSGVTSITGNHAQDTGVGLTSENWAQLMWVPDTSVVTVDDIDNGPSVYNWAYVGNDGFHIDSKEAMGSTRSWLFGKTGNLTMPLVTKLNSGGIGVTNSAEFGTEVVMGCVNVFSSEIYMGAGTAESRAIVDELGRSLIYTGVELPGFAGMVAIDPGVTSEYGIRVGANANIEIGAVVGPITTTEYVAGIGVLNDSYNINGLFANANVTVVGSGTHGWTFGADGTTTFPDGTTIGSAGFTAPLSTDFLINTFIDNTGDPGTKTWTFGTDGTTQLPDSSIIRTQNWGAFSLKSDNADIVIMTDVDNSRGWTFGADGNLTLPAGGEIHSATGTGNVVVQSNDGATAYNWTFETNGNLTFPDTTTQSTAYKRTTGSWTVATGSGTYSFTVPLNGTYTMWVRGNIDNGIVVWNATATVTNNNVPVIGSQRAWNYTDGGSTILITSIPSQILDEQATISTTMPIGIGTTSNRFDFVINNDSGSAQIVYWGYVTQ